jgi:hypothetical protein
MNPKFFYLITLLCISTLLSCKKTKTEEKVDEEPVKPGFFIQSTEASYDLDLANDNFNNLYIASSTKVRPARTFFNFNSVTQLQSNGQQDAYVAKFDENGKALWVTQLGDSNEDLGYVLTVDANQNVFVAGTFRELTKIGEITLAIKSVSNSSGNPNMEDIFVASLDHNGKVRWVKQIAGTGFERPTAIRVAPSGKVYLTGYFHQEVYFNNIAYGKPEQSAFFIACYDPNGTLDWGKIYGNINDGYPHYGSIYPSNLKIATNGDLLIAGSYEGQKQIGSVSITSTGDQDAFLSRFDKDGNVLWVRTFGGIGSENCPGLALDDNGTIYIGGSFRNQMTIGSNIFTSLKTGGSTFLAAYTSTGTLTWASQVGLPGAQYLFDLVVNEGKLHFVGYYDSAATIGDKQLTSTSTMQGFSGVYTTAGLSQTAENLGAINAQVKRILIDKKGFKVMAGVYGGAFNVGGLNYPGVTSNDLFVTKQP